MLEEQHVSRQERETKSLSRAQNVIYTLSRFLLLTRRIRAREIRRFSTLRCVIFLSAYFSLFFLLSFLTLLISSSIFFFTVLGDHCPSVHLPSFPARRRLTHSRRHKNAARGSLSPECAGRVYSKGSGCLVCKEPLKWCSLLSEDLERRCEERHAESYT